MSSNIAENANSVADARAPAPNTCSLEAALAYDNANIVDGFLDKFAVSAAEAEELFTETKKFLWLIALARGRRMRTPAVTDHIMVLDEMWHNFVLFTLEYRQYCDALYGFYVDHAPTTRSERELAAQRELEQPALVLTEWKAELRDQLSFIYDELGEETVVRWYETYPKRYSPRRLEELRRVRADLYIASRES